jgi:hypothetical protein
MLDTFIEICWLFFQFRPRLLVTQPNVRESAHKPSVVFTKRYSNCSKLRHETPLYKFSWPFVIKTATNMR